MFLFWESNCSQTRTLYCDPTFQNCFHFGNFWAVNRFRKAERSLTDSNVTFCYWLIWNKLRSNWLTVEKTQIKPKFWNTVSRYNELGCKSDVYQHDRPNNSQTSHILCSLNVLTVLIHDAPRHDLVIYKYKIERNTWQNSCNGYQWFVWCLSEGCNDQVDGH